MGSSPALHAYEVITTQVPKMPPWWQIRFSGASKVVRKLLGRKDHHVCSCKAIGFPVSDPVKTSDGRQLFELFVFDVELDQLSNFVSSVGARMLCVVPRIEDEIYASDELELTGNFVWSSEFGGYVVDVESLQVLDLGFR